VALIARFHTKALPDKSRHRRFAKLPSARREQVEWLSGILRVADSLDCNHANNVKQLSCKIDGKMITIHLKGTNDCRAEVERASQKDALLVRKAKRKIRYLC
jgi:exopolyphosphatase/guanosine-5'-triphosphate,3'-diphosphate pyrophosphatase